MRFIKLSAVVFAAFLFLTGCSALEPQQQTVVQPQNPNEIAISGDEYARDNLDLQAVGSLLEKSDNAEEFEYLLNSENGVNNIDLNGDGYVDYISVREFDDRDNDERGLSLFSRFGPDLIQEIATIIFDRNGGYNRPGARVLLTGNEQIYGDNYYYETNWLDRTLPLVTWLFNDRDVVYTSPYYYDNYPSYYDVYQVVETPVYRTRVVEYYPQPVFVQVQQPTITQIKIKSPNYGRSIEKIYSKLAKPTKEQMEFKQKNPNKPEFVPVKKGNQNKLDDKPKGNPNWTGDKPGKSDDKPVKIEKQDVKTKVEKSNPVKIDNPKPQKPQGNPNNPGGGNKGGGGKGGGKKP